MTVSFPEGTEPTPAIYKTGNRIQFDHYAVRANNTVTQYPQANGYLFDDDNNLVVTSDEVEGGRLALYPRGVWTAIYYPGVIRVQELYAFNHYDVDGNLITVDKEDGSD